MPRRHRALRVEPAARPAGTGARTEDFRGEAHEVRAVAGEHGKSYRCPGCDQLIAGGVRHVVVWRADGDGDDRRHWHTACWANRDRRGVTRRWS